jgi:hypothetical protein
MLTMVTPYVLLNHRPSESLVKGDLGLTAYPFHEVASAVCNHAKTRS